ncbi:TetR/AcrR family transcriptional regulator [Leifsonia sp. NPDC058292]|uniref:TetR/AcrR family transcriptional regulator n=1 Tax=Leifsonia sp. NPDC058292 TaxID=3346428 RepID=UPI0036DA333B
MSSPTGLRERKKLETRAAIHEAALRLVAENGVTQTSVDAICSEAVVSSRTFFNYFPSKFSAILGTHTVEISADLRDAFLATAGETNLVRDLCHLVTDVTASITRGDDERRAIRELLALRPELVPEFTVLITDLRRQLVELCRQRTSPERARLATSLVLSAMTCALDAPLDPRIDEDDDWLFAAVMVMHDLAGR